MTDTLYIDTQTKADQIYDAFRDAGSYGDVCAWLGLDSFWTIAEGGTMVQCELSTRVVETKKDTFALTLAFEGGFEYRVSGILLRYSDAPRYMISDSPLPSFDRRDLVAYVTSQAAAHHLHGERRPDWLRCFREIF